MATLTTTPPKLRKTSEGSSPAWRVTEAGTVPVADVARVTGVKYGTVDYVIRTCEVPIVSQFGQGRARYIALTDALLIFAAAGLAIAAGVALTQMVRAMVASGAHVDGGAVTIPLGKVA